MAGQLLHLREIRQYKRPNIGSQTLTQLQFLAIPYYVYTLLRLVALCALLYHGLAFLRTVILFSDTQENDNGRYIITSSGILSSNHDANNDWPRMNGREAERIYNSVMWATVIAFAMVFGTVRLTMNGHSSSSSSLQKKQLFGLLLLAVL